VKPRLLIANPDAPEPASSPGGGVTLPAHAPSPSASPAPTGPPLPKRPKGSLLIGGVLLAVVGAIAYIAWNATLRYAAFGTVTGESIAISPPWQGTVEAVLVREGDLVRQGDELVRLANPHIQDELERLADELRLGQSELDAHVAELTLAAQQSRDRQQLALAEYYKLVGEQLAEQARLSDLEARMARSEKLTAKGAVTSQDHDSARLAVEGQRAKVERLALAVAELQKRTDVHQPDEHAGERLKPKLVRIEQVQASIERLRERLRQGTVRAPSGGRVLAIHRHAGEYAEPAQPLVELLAEDSLEITLLVAQDQTAAYQVGQQLEVEMQPLAHRLACQVTRIGDAFCEPPAQIEARYPHGQALLPVHLKPLHAADPARPLRLGGEVRLPRAWTWPVAWGA
jgi:multidrug resistance efflux pump